MRSTPSDHCERSRVVTGPYASGSRDGNNGTFLLKRGGVELVVVVSDGLGWDHVSVSTARRCPIWAELCFVKGLFFGADETVLQYHPPKSLGVNIHKHCLHLWRQQGCSVTLPPLYMV